MLAVFQQVSASGYDDFAFCPWFLCLAVHYCLLPAFFDKPVHSE